MSETVYSSRYALTAGVQRIDNAEVKESGLVAYRDKSNWTIYLHNEGKEWHRTEDGAIARAEAMRQAKIASLKKSLAKLEKMRFDKS